MTIRWNGLDADLRPEFVSAVTRALAPLPTEYVAYSGLRSDAEQAADYAKGRDAAGTIVDATAVVTNAKPGQSAHNPGPDQRAAAVDFVPIVDGQELWGPFTASAYRAAHAAIMQDPTLKSGMEIHLASGPDYNHVELRNWSKIYQQTFAAEATGTPGLVPPGTVEGGGTSPTSGTSGGAPSSPSLADQVTQWFELDPGVAIGTAAILATLVLLWWARRG